MQLTIHEADELASLVCDRLCKHPRECAEEELENACESCPLVDRLLEEINKNGGKPK